MATKVQFQRQLDKIHNQLCKYSEEVFKEMTDEKYAVVRLKYAVILLALEDLYYGTQTNQADAMQYFKSHHYAFDCISVGIDKATMDYIIQNPHNYSENIGGEVNDEYVYI